VSVAALDAALKAFSETDKSVRLCGAMFAVLGLPSLTAYPDFETAASALHPGVAPGVLARARELAGGPETRDVLALAKSLDTGDAGISLYTGVTTALSFVWGKEPAGLRVDPQQRSDASIKALAIAYLVCRALPGPVPERLRVLESLPTGGALLRYFGSVEIALPFSAEVIESGGRYVADLVEKERGSSVPRLLPVVGKDGVVAMIAALTHVLPRLDELACEGVQHVGPLAETVKGYLPSVLGPGARDSLPDLVATGADSLPIYRYLLARLAAEVCLCRAREELEPGWRAVLPLPEPSAAEAEPGPDPFAPPIPSESPFAAATAPSDSGSPFAAPVVPATSPPVVAAFGSAPLVAEPIVAQSPAQGPPVPTRAQGPRPVGPPVPARTPVTPLATPPPSDAPPPVTPLGEGTTHPTLLPDPAAQPDDDPGEPIVGSFFRREGGVDFWLIFTRDGTFTAAPPMKPPPVDWDAHRRAGHPVGRYRRDGERLAIRWSDGTENEAEIVEKDYALEVDGRKCSRADFNLTGVTLDGTWRPRDEPTGGYRFQADGRFHEADVVSHSGTYALGPASISLQWDDGGSERLSLLSDLQPDREHPDVLYLAGQALDRQRS
jgi:hypothetical protein